MPQWSSSSNTLWTSVLYSTTWKPNQASSPQRWSLSHSLFFFWCGKSLPITITFLGSCYQPISSRTVILQLWDILPHDILIPEALCCVSSCICLVALISTASRAHPGHAKFLDTFWSAVAQFVFLPLLKGQAKCIDVCL
jgi:hypothetical protein